MAGMLSLLFLINGILISFCGASRTESGKYCITPCNTKDNPSSGEPSCSYDWNASETCVPAGDIMEYYTNDGDLCNGICTKKGTKYEWCFRGPKSWDHCSTSNSSEYPPKLWSKVRKYYERSAVYLTPYSKKDYCKYKNDPKKYVQQVDGKKDPKKPEPKKYPVSPCNRDPSKCAPVPPNEIERLINDFEKDDNQHVVVKYYGSSDDDAQSTTPVIAVTTFESPADAKHKQRVTVTMAIRAEIYSRHITSTMGSIPAEVNNQMRLLDREKDDEAGRLLGNSLGGPGNLYNFGPQSPMLNRAVYGGTGKVDLPPTYYDIEALIRRYLKQNPKGFVRWVLLVEYRHYPASRRPTGFRLSIRFYNSRQQPIVFEGGSVHEYFLPNVPTRMCKNLNDPWWSWFD